jgi:hypothetical protein
MQVKLKVKRLESQIKKGFRGKKHTMSDKENPHWLESPVIKGGES